jgi:glycosyltransferase involved in cell wall biosynthesis
MAKVSVVIPTYNRAQFLPETIRSVLSQSFRDFEIIVVDDGSTDKTREIVSAFPVKYIWQENQGAPAAYNKGITLAKGEYIAFLDSDDLLLKDALGKGIELLDRHPETGFSYGQFYLIDKKGTIHGLIKGPWKYSCVKTGKEEIGELILGNYISPHTIVRYRCLEEVGLFDPAFKHGSVDFELWVRLLRRYAVAYIAEPVMKYRVHSDTITSHRSLEEIERSRGAILEAIFNDTELSLVLSPQRPNAYFHLYFNLARDAYSCRRMNTARYYLFRALKTYPKGFFKGMWLPWIFRFAKTWIPLPILAMWRKLRRFSE